MADAPSISASRPRSNRGGASSRRGPEIDKDEKVVPAARKRMTNAVAKAGAGVAMAKYFAGGAENLEMDEEEPQGIKG